MTNNKDIERDQDRIDNTGEVFTPKWMVDKMLDDLPKEIWSDPDKIFLEPSCGDGNFLIEILHRLMNGLKDIIPDEYERKKHIVENQIYAIDLMTDNVNAVIKRLDISKFNHNIICNDALIFDFSEENMFEIDYYDLISNKKQNKNNQNMKINNDMFEF